MQTLLIVDDEQTIVEGLAGVLREAFGDSLNLLKAFSGVQAFSILRKHKIDVVLSDIRMPDMDGLELSRKTAVLWPNIHFIFLSGFDDFNYIHEASKSPIYKGYLLKTEGDRAILDKVRQELSDCRTEEEAELERGQMLKQLASMKGQLQRAYLESLLRGGGFGRELKIPTKELELNISFCRSFYMVLGKKQHMKLTRNHLNGIVALNRLVAESCRLFSLESLTVDQDTFVWLLQPNDTEAQEDNEKESKNYIYALFEDIQQKLHDTFGLPVSFVIGSKTEFPLLASQYELLTNIYRLTSVNNRELLILDQETYGSLLLKDQSYDLSGRFQFSSLVHKLERVLEGGTPEELTDIFLEFRRELSPDQLEPDQHLTLITLLFSIIREQNLSDMYYEETMEFMSRFLKPSEQEYELMMSQYMILCKRICEQRRQTELGSATNIIARINSYINSNVENYNLSLTELARLTGFNPSYLSRFYRLNAGIKLSDYIDQVKLNHARDLLRRRYLIKDVASRTGFASPSAFILFFKRNTGMTPKRFQETLEEGFLEESK